MTMRWKTLDPFADLRLMVSFTMHQTAFRFRNDDGNDTNATWIAGENVNVNRPVATPFRLRIQAAEVAGGSWGSGTAAALRYIVNDGISPITVTESSPVVRYASSSHIANNTVLARRLVNPVNTFKGARFYSAQNTAIGWGYTGNDHQEWEFDLTLMNGSVNVGDVIRFYGYLGPNAFASYPQVPTITVGAGVEPPPSTFPWLGLPPDGTI
jgi:hypothetical protein